MKRSIKRPFVRSIQGVMLNLLPVLFLPISTSIVDFPPEGVPVNPPEIAVSPESPNPNGSETYTRLERYAEPYGVKMEKLQQILQDFKTGLSPGEEQRLAQFIYEESLEYQYDPELILAIIAAESSFNNWSRSRMGAIGLMQIMPITGSSLAKTQNISWIGNMTLFDPFLNIKLGIKYLAMLQEEFDDLQIALTAYNYGPTRVRKIIKRNDQLPKKYAEKVLSTYERFLAWNHVL